MLTARAWLKVKQFAQPYLSRFGRTLIEQGARLVRFSKVEEKELPLIKRYTGGCESVLDCCIAYNEHGGYCVPLSSRQRPVAQRILQGEVHEKDTIEYIAEVCGKGDIVHAGAYFGDFIPALSRQCSDEATVWAFEPNPENYRCAEITTMINRLENVKLYNAALGSSDSHAALRVENVLGGSVGGNSSVESNPSTEGRVVNSRLVRVDDIVPDERTISVLQLDVEGFERQALSGSIETINRCKPAIILENKPDDEWMNRNILSIGYKCKGMVGHNYVFEVY